MASSTNAERAADILLCLGEAGGEGASLKDIAAALGQPKPAVLRTLTALAMRGFVEQVARGRYRLGPSIYALAKRDNAASRDVERWRAVLMGLAERYGHAFYLVGRAGLDAVILDMAVGRAPVQTLTSGIGGRLPLGIGSGSIAILSTLTPSERRLILDSNARHFSAWGVTQETIDELVDRAIHRGFAWDLGHYIPDCGGIAVPVRDHGAAPAHAAITLSAPASFLTPERIDEVAGFISSLLSGNVDTGAPS